MLESLSRPHLLITDTYNALNVQARRKERDQALLSECPCACMKPTHDNASYSIRSIGYCLLRVRVRIRAKVSMAGRETVVMLTLCY